MLRKTIFRGCFLTRRIGPSCWIVLVAVAMTHSVCVNHALAASDAAWQPMDRDFVPHSCHGITKDPGRPKKPKRTLPGDRDRGDCPPARYRQCDRKRTGGFHRVAFYAQPSITKKYSAWFVGGGAWRNHYLKRCKPRLAEARDRKFNGCGQYGEGTWGLDYAGLFGKANIWLRYTPHKKQGGEGAYRTDGEPKVVARAKKLREQVAETLRHADSEEHAHSEDISGSNH